MSDEILAVVREVLGRHTKERRLLSAPPADVSLYSLAIASVEMIGIVVELEDRFGCSIDDARMLELQTVADLVRVIASQAPR